MEFLNLAVLLITCISFGCCSQYFVVAPGGAKCPEEYVCHDLSYYVNDVEEYFTSDTVLTFLQGTHYLEQDGPVVIKGVSNLTLQGEGEIEDGYHWTVKQSNVFIKCNHSNSGLLMETFDGVTISGLTVSDCGFRLSNELQSYISLHYFVGTYTWNSAISQLASFSLLMINGTNAFIEQFSVQNGTGYGLAIVNVFNIDIISSTFSRNNFDCNEYVYSNTQGGNIRIAYIESTQCPAYLTNSSVVSIRNVSSSFGKNCGTYSTQEPKIYFSDGVVAGGGLALFGTDYSCSRIEYELDTVNIVGNIAVLGANMLVFGLPMPMRINKLNNSYGRGRYNSGGLAVVIAESLPVGVKSTLNITGSNFTDNFGTDTIIGAALYLALYGSRFYDQLLLQSCYITGNSGISIVRILKHSNLNANLLIVNLTDVVISDNYEGEAGSETFDYLGAVVLINCVCYSSGLQVINSPYTGITMYSSSITFTGENLIQNNSYINGGGMVLSERSTIIFRPPTVVSFFDNHAEGYGGAIYIPFGIVRNFISSCFYQIDDPSGAQSPNVTINAINNTAGISGDFVSGGELLVCSLVLDSAFAFAVSFSRPLGLNVLQSFIQPPPPVPNLHFISSNPVGVKVCNSSGDVLDGRAYLLHFNVSLGKLFNVSVASAGQTGALSPGGIMIQIFNCSETIRACVNPKAETQLREISYSTKRTCTDVPMVIEANRYTTRLSLVFSTASRVSFFLLRELHLIVYISECPPGFVKEEICVCNDYIRRIDSTITCNINTSNITTNGQVWIGYDSTTNCTVVSENCDYCIGKNTTFNILNPDPQCAFHRSGVLCGGCADGYSLLLGTNECDECPNDHFLSLLLVFGVAGILLVVFLIGLNLTVSVGTINGLIFYANVIKVNDQFFFSDESQYSFSKVFISFLNLDLGVKTCFYEDMTPYSKAWLQFVFPVYLWLIMIVIILASRRSTKLAELIGNNAVKVLATLWLLSYTKIIRAIGVALETEYVQCDGDSRSVWRYNGNTPYTDLNHVILVLFALVFLIVFVLPYSCFLMSLPVLDKVLTKMHCRCLWLKPFSDAYSGPFKDTHRFWVGLLLITRVILIIIEALSSSEQVSLFATIFSVLILLTLALDLKGPYEKNVLNILESWFLANLLGVYIFAFGGEEAREISTLVSVSLVFVSFVVILVFHAYEIVTKHFQRVNKIFHFMHFKAKKREAEMSDKFTITVGTDASMNKKLDSPSVSPTSKIEFSEFRDSILENLDIN